MQDALNIDSLFHRAWTRYTSRLGKVLLTGFLTMGFIIVAIALFFILGAMGAGIIAWVKHPLLFLIGLPFLTALAVALMYLFSWSGLAYMRIVTIDDAKLGVWQNFMDTRTYVWRYLWFGLLSGLFIYGLWYTYILIFPLIVWAVWSVFAPFVFLYEGGGGLQPLWRSREIVKGHFWQVVGRFFLIGILSVAIMMGFSLTRQLKPLAFFVQILFLQPFGLSFNYEMYKALKDKKRTKQPSTGGVWIYLSIVGWVLIVILGILFIGVFSRIPRY